jgi:hypothetical protein
VFGRTLGTFGTIGLAFVLRHDDHLKSNLHPRRRQGWVFAYPSLYFPTSTDTLDITSQMFGNAHFEGLIPIDAVTGTAYSSITLEDASLFRTTVNLNRKPLCDRMLTPCGTTGLSCASPLVRSIDSHSLFAGRLLSDLEQPIHRPLDHSWGKRGI